MRTRALFAFFVSALLAVSRSAGAQSFNVDINSTSGFGAGVPSSTYAAAGGSPGAWNSILSTSPTTVPLLNLDGSPSSVTFTRTNFGVPAPFYNTSNLTTTGNFSFLHDDYQTQLFTDGWLRYTFSGLAAGRYVVFTYAANPDDPDSRCMVRVTGTGSMQDQLVGGAIVGNNWIPGTTHSIHALYSVGQGSSVTIDVRRWPGVYGWPVCGGIQLVKLPDDQPIKFYVNDNAPGSNAGGSWNDAYTDLQRALASARLINGEMPANSLCEVWVAQGTYRPGTDRNNSFLLPPELRLYGGFQGNETSLSQRLFPALYITILSGAIGTGADTDNSYNVVKIDGNYPGTIVMDGFSIARGYADGFGSDSVGGGMYVRTYSPFYCRNCKFISNTARGPGGAITAWGDGPVHFENCLFFRNTSNDSGGAIGATTAFNSFSFVNCQFLGNTAAGDGGAIVTDGSTSEFVNCVFSGNTAGSSPARGGAAIFGGTNYSTSSTFRGCTFSHNLCGGGTGGVHVDSNAHLDFHNCILWDKADANGPGSFDDNITANTGAGGTYTVSYTTVQGLSGQNGQNPQFVDADGPDNVFGTSDDNLRLQLTSPCIDAGDSAQVGLDSADLDADGNTTEPTPLDLALNPRRVNVNSVPDTGAGGAPMPDRGAFETIPPPCPGDLNGDGQRNTLDLVIFLGEFGTSGPNIPSDLNNDGVVNTLDLTQFLGQFGVPCP